MQPAEIMQQRIKRNIAIDDNGCWIWQRRVSPNGYGLAWLSTSYAKGMNTSAHRVSYLAFKGAIPEGYHIDHLCKVRACVNPEHLEAVTPRENVRRSNAKYKSLMARTHCPKGHEYTPENTYTAKTKHGGISRSCATCSKQSSRHRAALKRMIVHAA